MDNSFRELLESVWKKQRAPIKKFLRNRIRNHEDVEDLLGEIYVEFIERKWRPNTVFEGACSLSWIITKHRYATYVANITKHKTKEIQEHDASYTMENPVTLPAGSQVLPMVLEGASMMEIQIATGLRNPQETLDEEIDQAREMYQE